MLDRVFTVSAQSVAYGLSAHQLVGAAERHITLLLFSVDRTDPRFLVVDNFLPDGVKFLAEI